MGINITLPVYNEECDLAKNVPVLVEHCSRMGIDLSEIVIADNGSWDGTPDVGRALARRYDQVTYVRIEVPGRGGALKHAWTQSRCSILSYMDIDLSASIEHLSELIGLITDDKADICTGTRHSALSAVSQGMYRRTLSSVYSKLVRALFDLGITDTQCGFKALSSKASMRLLPSVRSSEWFFDTEMLIMAGWMGLRVMEIPIRWDHDVDSRVKMWKYGTECLWELRRMHLARRRWESVGSGGKSP